MLLIRVVGDQLDIGGTAEVVSPGGQILLLQAVGQGLALTLPAEAAGGDESGEDDDETESDTNVHSRQYYRSGRHVDEGIPVASASALSKDVGCHLKGHSMRKEADSCPTTTQ
jgi:hypothetical protein